MNISEFEKEVGRDKILLKYKGLLKKLAIDSQVVCITKTDENEFYLQECCDDWYGHILTKEECLELSELFKEIAERIENV